MTLPNMVTLANLACGCMAVVYATGKGDGATVFALVAAAAVFDFGDGLVARLTGQYSEVGKQLDSLADMVSFGVAPSAALFAAWQAASTGGESALLPAATVFVVALCAALRLARFNVDDEQKEEFTGLPTPAAALGVTALLAGWPQGAPHWAVGVMAGAAATLMVCPLRMFSLKFKGFGWKGNEVRYTFLATAAVTVSALGVRGVAASVGLYVVLSAGLWCRNRKK